MCHNTIRTFLKELKRQWLTFSCGLLHIFRFDYFHTLQAPLLILLYRSIETSEEMREFDRVCIYVDNRFQAEDSFTVRTAHSSFTVGGALLYVAVHVTPCTPVRECIILKDISE